MAKYRALVDALPIKKGDVVNFEDPLVDGFKDKFVAVGDDEEVTVENNVTETALGPVGEKTLTGNPSREELKLRANELGIVFASNTPTAKLQELVTEAQEQKDADDKAAAEAAALEAAKQSGN